jgi:peptidoglycan/LPS O-acetylase OafA/YrhL
VLAVLAVLLQHATHTGPSLHPEFGAPAFEFPLYVGASTLMVISAFFACASLAKGEPGRFLRNRIARLLPAYAVAVVLTYLVLRWVAPPGWSYLEPHDVVANLLLLQQWVPGVRQVDFAHWTIPVQVFAFTAGALLFGRRAGHGPPLRVLLWVLVAAPLVVRSFADEPGIAQAAFYGFGMHRAQLFAAGVAIWLWSGRRLRAAHLALLLAAVLVADGVHSAEPVSTAGFGLLLLVVIAAAAGPDWTLLRPLTRPVSWLAGISYGVYLVHQEIGAVVVRGLVGLGFGPWTWLAGFLGSAVLLGWALTVLVERPAHRWLTAPERGAGLVRLLLALRLHAVRWVYAQSGSSGVVPIRPVPSWRPVSQASTSEAEPRTSSDLALLPTFTSQVR